MSTPVALRLLLLAIGLAPGVARAGTPDLLVHIADRPAGSDSIALTYEHGGGGLLYSRDRGASFSALCSAAIGAAADGGFDAVRGLQDTLITGDGHVLVADLQGLWVDDGNLCDWTRAPGLGWVTSLTLDPRDTTVAYGAEIATAPESSGLFRRNANGSFERFGERSAIKIVTVRAVERPDGGLRFYTVALTGQRTIIDADAQMLLPDGGSRPASYERDVYALRYSDDDGVRWTEHEVDTPRGEAVWLEAIDTASFERVVLRLEPLEGTDTLLVADGGGSVQTRWMDVEELRGVVVEPGGVAWIAGDGRSDGVWRAESIGETAVKVREEGASCIALHAGELELCDREDYGVADRASVALEAPRLYFTVDRVHTCENIDVVERCRESFCLGRCAGNHFYDSPMCVDSYGAQREIGCSSGSTVIMPDAGAADAGAPASAARGSSGCGCTALGARPPNNGLSVSLAFVLVARLFARARRRARATSRGSRSAGSWR